MTDNTVNFVKDVNPKTLEDWTPRQVLLSLLQRIDAGKDIDTIFVAYSDPGKDGGERDIGWAAASPCGTPMVVGVGQLALTDYAANDAGYISED